MYYELRWDILENCVKTKEYPYSPEINIPLKSMVPVSHPRFVMAQAHDITEVVHKLFREVEHNGIKANAYAVFELGAHLERVVQFYFVPSLSAK